MLEHMWRQVRWKLWLPRDDVRHRANRKPDPAGATIGQVESDLHAGAARPNHKDVLAPKLVGIPVVRTVKQGLAKAASPRPVRDRGSVVVARGDHNLRRADVAVRCTNHPSRFALV